MPRWLGLAAREPIPVDVNYASGLLVYRRPLGGQVFPKRAFGRLRDNKDAEGQDMFGWLKRRGKVQPAFLEPRLSGYPTFVSDELMAAFGITRAQAKAALDLYEAMVAREVHDPVAKSILAQPDDGPKVQEKVTRTIGQAGLKDNGVLALTQWLSFVGLVRKQTQRMLDNGITEGRWASANWTDCITHATAHRTLNDCRFALVEGLAFDGVVERPGVRPRCQCRVVPIIEWD
jgi:hypothetical protein